MQRKEMTFRITKIGKTAVSVAVCGLMMASPAFAEILSSLVPSAQNVANEPVDTYSGTGLGIDVYYQDALNDGIQPHSNAVTMTLSSGADLSGLSPTGGAFLSIYSRDVRDAGDADNTGDYDIFTFSGSTSSLLVLEGNNTIGGDVGYHLSFVGGNPVTYTYGSINADAIDEIQINGDVQFNRKVNASRINILSGAADVVFDDLVDINGTIDASGTTIDYNGYNATVTLSDGVTLNGSIINKGGALDAESPVGDRTNGGLYFLGNGAVTGTIGDATSGLALIQFDGSGDAVTFGGSVTANQLNYGAASNVTINGSLLMTPDASSAQVLGVTFNDKAGSLNIVGGNLTGLAGQVVASNTVADRGTLTFTGAGTTQTVTGELGQSGKSLLRLNIGGASTDNSASVTVNGNIYATSIVLQNDSVGTTNDSLLTLASGYNATGAITTDAPGMGDLTLAGGTQTVTGTVGANGASLDTVTSGAAGATSTFTGAVYATNVTNSGTGTSTFQANVNATNVGVNGGTSNFQQSLTATTTTIGTGTGNFNTVGGTTSSNILFAGAGTANLNKGLLTGNIYFSGQPGTVNLVNGESISGFIKGGDTLTSTTVAGTLNALGGGTLSSDVGKLTALNVNKFSADAEGDTLAADKTNVLQANGNVDAASVKLFNDGTLKMAAGKTLTGAITTTTDGTGSLTFDGASAVTGNVGAAGTALKSINAGVGAGQTDRVTFTDGVVYANTLNYEGNREVTFYGLNPQPVIGGVFDSDAKDLGFVGTVDFGVGGSGTFTLGDNVDLITGNADETGETTFVNANLATLRFEGSSVVTGDLGSSANTSKENFKDIYAGVNGETVTFRNKVFVASTTFHVSGTGTVNFLDDLTGPLVYDENGTVNVGDGVNINGPVLTDTDNQGTLNFVGSATTQASIGESNFRPAEVNFHKETSDSTVLPVSTASETVGIGHDIYAVTTSIGNGTNPTVATITATGKHLGTNLVLSDTTTLNTAGAVIGTNAISPVDFLHTKNANGTLTNTATVTKSNFGNGTTGTMTTAGATLNFALATTAWDANAGGTANAAGSSSITGGTGSTLVMNGSESVNLSLLGSLRDGESYTLIDVASDNDNTALPLALNVKDNSYVITTAVTRSNNNTDDNADLDGDLVVTATRADDVYITASNTTGHFSNPAALRLGTLAAAGASYSSDMQTVLNKLDIDQWGFGNNAANLAVQAQRLAPLANNSIGLSAFTAASAVSDSLGMRMHQIRIPEQAQAYEAKGVWLRSLYNQGKQEAVGQYDGFKSKVTGMTFGVDAYPSRDSLVGLAVSYSTTDVEQQNFRLGDEASMDAWHLSMYAAYNFTPEWFVDGTLTGSKVNTTGNRSTAVGRVASFDVDGSQWTGKVNLGYRFKLGDSAMFLTPILSLQSSSLKQDAYNETGAGDIGLEVAGSTLRQNQAALGLRLDGTTYMGGMVVKPEITLAATRDSGAYGKDISAQFIGDLTNTAFTTESAEASGLNGVKLSMGLGVLLNKTTSMALRYEHAQKRHSGVSGKAFSSDAVEFNVRWNF